MQYTRVTGNYWPIYWKLPKMFTFFQHFCCYSFIKFIAVPKFSGSKYINLERNTRQYKVYYEILASKIPLAIGRALRFMIQPPSI